ncbi:4Fe-4S dicluster domain-containing protein [Sporomusa sp. KB1]|jgi:2-oxoglutarate ferredoxin oxidoreductase subunit delta|uniref:4Fe-4S dicluster domain-containing protein n=1 Tax=Sporomusa sp. KB1 TaxID=943346 RepID=UPI0011AAC63B|nr:4Fe-4S dicluster domain-containing protein [Sporomusa sp. KB1]TWH51972.1 2-oxoglutarate ferredoxin oxidoreductase subunit delta [Sporomusa sp. KB1]
MAKPIFRVERCKGCELCLDACPKNIIAMSSDFNAKGYHPASCPDASDCIGCALCAKTCPDVVIEIHK